MRIKRGWKLVLGVLGALTLMTNPASAHTDFSTWTLSSYSTNAYADHVTGMTFGSTRATTMTIDVAPGFTVTYSQPNDGDVVGSGTATARWWLLFCASSTQNLTAYWETTINGSAPANTVAQINIVNAIGFTTYAYVTLSSGDYKIQVPDMPDEQVCSTTTNGATSLTILGTVAGTTRHVIQNPSTTGTKTSTNTYVDTTGASHSDDVSVTIT